MVRKLFLLAVVAIVAGCAAFWFITRPVIVTAAALPAYTPDAVRGQAVFNAGGCASCHAVPGEARTMLGGGLAIPSPFGTFYVPNISPHKENGIGNWSEAEFVTAVKHGTSPAGEHYYPSFPYGSYTHATDNDIRDLFAYIKTLPPLSGRPRPHDVKFPFNIRRLVGGWKFLFLDDKPFTPDPKQSAAWNRGAYLVNSLGHCAECHSPRNFLGGIVASQRFAGGPNPEGQGWVPNITQKGLKAWSDKELAWFLKTGETPDGDTAGGSMARVIKNTSQLSDEDLAAMATYLKSLPPVDGPERPKKS
ncbi:MAG: alkylated DNA repair protein [Afipia sp. 62-7]|nr:cytochrome c [Afipia sp.]OJU21385.1 MAG: alkylated DNA repair protein [Afipia sp. 62-7]